jgi:O-antigen ligase
VGLLFLCLFVSYSRGAYLGVVAGLVALVALRSRVAAVALLVVAAVMALILYPAFLEARQGGELSPSDAYDMLLSENSRATIAAAAVAMFAAYPIFGVGYGVFQFASPAYFEGGSPDSSFSHNQYLNVLAEQGIVGVAIVGGLLALLAIHLRRSTSPYRGPALAMGATFLATSLFLHSATVFQSSSLIWLVMAAALATGRDRTDRIAEA